MALSVSQEVPDGALGEVIDDRLRELRLRIDSVKRRVQATRPTSRSYEHYLLLHQLDRLRGELRWHRNVRTVLAYRADEQFYPRAQTPR